MALIVITVSDVAGQVQVGVVCEPPVDDGKPATPAQVCANTMLTAVADVVSKPEPGRIQLLNG